MSFRAKYCNLQTHFFHYRNVFVSFFENNLQNKSALTICTITQSVENQLKVQDQKCPVGRASNLFAFFQASYNMSNSLPLSSLFFLFFFCVCVCTRIPSHELEGGRKRKKKKKRPNGFVVVIRIYFKVKFHEKSLFGYRIHRVYGMYIGFMTISQISEKL